MSASTTVWPDEVDEVLRGDLTAAVAYITPAGGAVVTAVAPCGNAQRETAMVGFTTSLGLHRKLDRILREPRVAMAYHAREHGRSQSSRYVLVQGLAQVELVPSRERLQAFMPHAESFLGPIKRGPVWDRLLHEYYYERVFVDVAVKRLSAWPELSAAGVAQVWGAPGAEPAPAQVPPAGGTGPRLDVAKAARRIASMPHVVLAYRGADGFPVILPATVASHGPAGLEIEVASGLLPVGGRRAGLLAHGYEAQLIGIRTQNMTGWLEVTTDGRVTYAPHTMQGWNAPPSKTVLLVMNGLLAKFGYRKAVRDGVLERLQQLQRAPANERVVTG
jgi:hypothetical protein